MQISRLSLISIFIFVCNARRNSSTNVGFELLFTTENSEVSNFNCAVTGNIPEWLSGTLIRNGPGKFEAVDREFTHWFDGFSKLHSFTFDGNTQNIRFNSRFLETVGYTESQKGDFYPTIFFGDVETPLSTLEKITGLYHNVDNTNVNVFKFGDEIVAMSDYWEVYGFDKNTLSDAVKIRAELPGDLPEVYNKFHIMSVAHPLQEYGTGAAITVALIDSPLPFYSSTINVIRASAVDNRELIASIEVERASYMHSFAMTENYAVLFVDPIFVNPLSMLRDGAVVNALTWNPERTSNVYIVSLKDGSVETLKVSARFHAHHVNAFEKNGEIHIQCVTYQSFEPYLKVNTKLFKNETLRKQEINMEPTLITYVIDANHETIIRKRDPLRNKLSTRMDFPAINEEYRFKENCYTYGVTYNADKTDFATMVIVKRDICQGKDTLWYKSSHYPSEPIFVPNPNGTSEDDGVLLSVVMDGTRKESYLLVLDAKTMETRAVSVVPHLIPYSIHGQFFA